MVNFSIPASLREIVNKAIQKKCTYITENEKSILIEGMNTNSININHLRCLKKYLLASKPDKTLLELIKGTKLHFPEFDIHEKESDPLLLKDMQRRREYLKLKQEDREYNMMVYGSHSNPHIQKTLSHGNQFSSMKNQMSVGINMIVSVFAGFGMGYYIGLQLKYEHGTALVIGLAASVVITIIEMILFILRATRIEGVSEAPSTAATRADAQFKSGSLNIEYAHIKSNEKKQKDL